MNLARLKSVRVRIWPSGLEFHTWFIVKDKSRIYVIWLVCYFKNSSQLQPHYFNGQPTDVWQVLLFAEKSTWTLPDWLHKSTIMEIVIRVLKPENHSSSSVNTNIKPQKFVSRYILNKNRPCSYWIMVWFTPRLSCSQDNFGCSSPRFINQEIVSSWNNTVPEPWQHKTTVHCNKSRLLTLWKIQISIWFLLL